MRRYLFGICVFTLLPLVQAQTPGGANALSFDGIDDHVVVASNASLTLNTSLTFEAWVYTTEAKCNAILSRGDGGVHSDYVFQVGYNGLTSCNARTIAFWAAGAWDASSATIPLNVWTHVAVTYDGTNKNFYINGVLDRSVARPGTLYESGSPVYIGRQGTGCNCNFFKGQIDELRIWNTVRTSNEISQKMSASLAGNETGLVAYYRFDEGSGPVTADATGNGSTGTLTNGTAWVSSTAPLGLSAFTQQASSITTNSATLNGAVNPANGPAVAWFNYGATTNYGSSTTPINISATNVLVPVSATISGLTPATVYHFQLVATNNSGLSRGADVAFTTGKPIANGDFNGDGVVDQNELNSVLSNYWSGSSLYMTNPAALGGGAFQFAVTNIVGWGLGVQVSRDLTTWTNLPTSALPVFQFLDPDGGSSSERFYRVRSR